MSYFNTKKFKPFEQALPYGEDAQERVADLLRRAGGFANRKDAEAHFDFELVFNNHTFRVEVKNEDNYSHTGNIAIELMQSCGTARERKSGLAISTANLCVHTFKNSVAVYKRDDMYSFVCDVYRKRCVEVERGSKVLRLDRMGDNGNQGYILPISGVLIYPWFDFLPASDLASSPLWRNP